MKKIIILYLSIASCNIDNKSENQASINNLDSKTKLEITNKDESKTVDSSWIIAFRELRDDIYQKRPENFVEFPFMDKRAQIWYLIESLKNENKSNRTSLTEKEFKQYYKEIFHKEFIELLLSVKSEKLFKANKFSKSKKISQDSEYKLDVEFEKNELSLTINYNGKDEVDKGQIEDIEWTESFKFQLIKGKFILKEILLAG